MKEESVGEKSRIFINTKLRRGTGCLRSTISKRLWFDHRRRDYDCEYQEPAETACAVGFHDFPPRSSGRCPHPQWFGQRLVSNLAGKPGKSLNEILEFCW